ncbi:MAG: glycosyltransferase family 4 protein [Microscillaceae bacterium]|nr:glycosyltransferase family 4 protein [Microscillaceae bacterium]
MKIVYIHQYFRTPEEGGAIRSYYLATALAAQGHQVELICAYSGKKYRKRMVEGVLVHELPIPYNNRMGKWARIKAFLKFVWMAFGRASRIPQADLYYVSSTPLTVGLIALLLKKLYRKKYYFEARDLWPEVPIALGVIRGRLMQFFLRYLEKQIYIHAEKLIALSPGIREGMLRQAPQKEVYLIPNLADCTFFNPQPYISQKKISICGVMYDWGEGFLITYFGSLGRANALSSLVDIAAWFQENKMDGVQFLIVGDGAEKEKLLQKMQNLQNICLIKTVNKYDLREILNLTDITYISFLNHPILETTSPNKFFDALAAGKLCVINFKGWLKDMVEQERCGFYANPEQPEVFYEKLNPFLQNPALLREYQKNARKLAKSRFSKQLLVSDFIELFN